MGYVFTTSIYHRNIFIEMFEHILKMLLNLNTLAYGKNFNEVNKKVQKYEFHL